MTYLADLRRRRASEYYRTGDCIVKNMRNFKAYDYELLKLMQYRKRRIKAIYGRTRKVMDRLKRIDSISRLKHMQQSEIA